MIGAAVWGGLAALVVAAWVRNWPQHVAEEPRPGRRRVIATLYVLVFLVCLAGVIGALGAAR